MEQYSSNDGTKKSSSSAPMATSFITRLPSTTPGATINVNSNPNAKKISHQRRWNGNTTVWPYKTFVHIDFRQLANQYKCRESNTHTCATDADAVAFTWTILDRTFHSVWTFGLFNFHSMFTTITQSIQ